MKEESLSALEVLGIPKKMSEKIADRILKQNPDFANRRIGEANSKNDINTSEENFSSA